VATVEPIGRSIALPVINAPSQRARGVGRINAQPLAGRVLESANLLVRVYAMFHAPTVANQHLPR
jgi:hypothetical protein